MNATRPDIHEYTLPAYWASYLINGDASGLSPDDKANADSFLQRNALHRDNFIDCGEEFFSSRSDDSRSLAGDMCLYTYLPLRTPTALRKP